MSGQRSTSAAGHVSLEVGQAFNPFGLFNGIYIPEALVKAKGLSAGAKMTYGRLTRYAGQNGVCFPSVRTLAAEIGMSERQPQRYLSELEKNQLIRRVARCWAREQRVRVSLASNLCAGGDTADTGGGDRSVTGGSDGSVTQRESL